jgi:AcrR family transcriptional regulator
VRVTAETKIATRSRILEAARALFADGGYEAATTRDIAAQAGIGVGTLFNYFPSKEAIAMTMVAECLQTERRKQDGRRRCEGLEEDLFALVAADLRALRPHRGLIRPLLETALSPLAEAEASSDAEAVRVEHLEVVNRLVATRAEGEPLSPLALNLYWTLYTGALAFWACDSSPKQEDTLAVLDHYVRAFVGSLRLPVDSSTKGPT